VLKEFDIDGDNTPDWLYPEAAMVDEARSFKLLWCIDHGRGSQFVWEYIPGPGEPGAGKRKFIGLCEFGGGSNKWNCVQKTIDGKKRFTSAKWINTDKENTNSTVKERVYDFDTRTCKLTQTTIGDDGSTKVNENADPPLNDGDRNLGLPLPAGSSRLVQWAYAGLTQEEEELTQSYAVPPLCFLSGQTPQSITVTTQDSQSGLASIRVTRQDNATVSVPTFDPGTRDPVVVLATKNNLSQSSRVELEVTDVAGNVTRCDPVLTLVVRERGKPSRETLAGLPEAEGMLSLYGGPQGLHSIEVSVNGVKFRTAVADGEERTLDISAAMLPGDRNLVTLTARGQPGGSATVVIHE
jgi:hypothetical protein